MAIPGELMWHCDLGRLHGVLQVFDPWLDDRLVLRAPLRSPYLVQDEGRAVAFTVGVFGKMGVFISQGPPLRVGGHLIGEGQLTPIEDEFGEASLAISGRDSEVTHLSVGLTPDSPAFWWGFGDRANGALLTSLWLQVN